MIRKIEKGNYNIVKADSGKLRIKGDMKNRVYSEATELKDKPYEYEEVPNDSQD